MSATKRTGKRCTHPAMRGAAVCRLHGGYRAAGYPERVVASKAVRVEARRIVLEAGRSDVIDWPAWQAGTANERLRLALAILEGVLPQVRDEVEREQARKGITHAAG